MTQKSLIHELAWKIAERHPELSVFVERHIGMTGATVNLDNIQVNLYTDRSWNCLIAHGFDGEEYRRMTVQEHLAELPKWIEIAKARQALKAHCETLAWRINEYANQQRINVRVRKIRMDSEHKRARIYFMLPASLEPQKEPSIKSDMIVKWNDGKLRVDQCNAQVHNLIKMLQTIEPFSNDFDHDLSYTLPPEPDEDES